VLASQHEEALAAAAAAANWGSGSYANAAK
jgi:hypothetical protein